MSDKLSTNLDLLMSEARLNAEELSRRIGIPATTIKKIRTNINSNPTLSTLSPLAKFFSLTIGELVGEEPFPQDRIKGSFNKHASSLTQLPLLSWQDAIKWPIHENKNPQIITTENLYSQHAFSLLVEEEGLENIEKGTVLLIDPAVNPDHRDLVIAYKKGQKLPSLKQILFDEDKTYFKPLHKGYEITPKTDEHKILGVVVEYKKIVKNNLRNNDDEYAK